jgi:RHH-type proline utilization regulon transcriptional repressor/proline dehydrogenase/delta 1-pyrroline-5-carboxylate dehydrogenase
MQALFDAIAQTALTPEDMAVADLLARTEPLMARDGAIRARAGALIEQQRAAGAASLVESFLQSYGLSTTEGIALLCLAEALLRIPDARTADALIDDSFAQGDWKRHLGSSDSLLVNASSWGLLLTGSVLRMGEGAGLADQLGALVRRSGAPVIRKALRAAMALLGEQFVMGETIAGAMKQARGYEKRGYAMSYDMLGEGARSEAQAQHYLQSYLDGVAALSGHGSASLSVKLSALHPRYQPLQAGRMLPELLERVKTILRAAKQKGVAVAFDAEEAYRLEMSLQVLEALLRDPEFAGYDGIGWVMQAYQKRAVHVAQWLAALARDTGHRMNVRLVKGAYWDGEIKRAQQLGLRDYPVFTRKEHTDLSYLACAQILLASDHLFPQFATHNALTAAAVLEMAGDTSFEFQRLHGMGEALHDQLLAHRPSRIYAPVGEHKDLLAYLIRRLLENGANSSFVHLLADRDTPVDVLTTSPMALAQRGLPPALPLPPDLYGARRNSEGLEWGYGPGRTTHLAALAEASYPPAPAALPESAAPMLVQTAQAAWGAWQARPVAERAAMLRCAADAMQQRLPELCALCVREAKKTHDDAVAEVREAIDFLRYYADEAERVMVPVLLPGPVGERNSLSLHGRGVFVCISPWNFPLAIFTGQVAAALVSGNAVIAKPAEQTPRIAHAACAILHEAGVPAEVLQLACGPGEGIGAALVRAPGVAGVCFTGSMQVAKLLQRALAENDGPIVPLIAETGGQNAMIVDSSALLEQAVDDIVASAFGAAGQRCSALRVLCVQEEIMEPLWALLCGAMDTLTTGEASAPATDIPPVIDEAAQAGLLQHIERMRASAKRWHAAPAPEGLGTFVVPHMVEIASIAALGGEQFGPVLHVVPYRADALDALIASIHATGYGLTFGLQSRLPSMAEKLLAQVQVGNRYVNRSMIGAVVGVQPFGGEGLSGTGPKAGGPHYLPRFCAERTTTINTAAVGGNIELLARGG